jgi:hypothetical protein
MVPASTEKSQRQLDLEHPAHKVDHNKQLGNVNERPRTIHDRLAAEGAERNGRPVLVRPLRLEIVEGSARRRRGRVHRHVLHVVSARWPGDESRERGCGRGEEQAMSLGAPRAQRKPRLSAV